MKSKWFILGLIVVGGVVTAMLLHRKPTPQVASAQSRQASPVLAPTVEPPAEPPPAESVKAPPAGPTSKPKPAAQTRVPVPNMNPPKEPLHDPDARDALALVGVDPGAEQYWLDAIYDSSLPDNERADLMEDLNETGFADPKNLTTDDLPLIAGRLEIIDSILPNTDPFMRDHLLEAQKDLYNMVGQVAGQ